LIIKTTGKARIDILLSQNRCSHYYLKLLLIWDLKNVDLIEVEGRMMVTRVWGVWGDGWGDVGQRIQNFS
jgi:hypothetical protein